MTSFSHCLFSRNIFAYTFSNIEGAKNVFWPWLSLPREWVVWLWYYLVNLLIYGLPFHLAMAPSQCLMEIGRDNDLSTLYPICRFACCQRMLKAFLGPGYVSSKDDIVLTMTLLGKFACIYIYIYIYIYICIYIHNIDRYIHIYIYYT